MKQYVALPKSEIAQDKKLTRDIDNSEQLLQDMMRQLAHLRFWWTKDPDNENRMSVAAYSRQVGVHSRTISRYVKMYEVMQQNPAI